MNLNQLGNFSFGFFLFASIANAAAPLQIACFEKAREYWTLSDRQRVALCSRARSNAPIDCFEEARKYWLLSNNQRVWLCAGARSTAPIDCFEKAREYWALSGDLGIQLCSEAPGNPLREPEKESIKIEY